MIKIPKQNIPAKAYQWPLSKFTPKKISLPSVQSLHLEFFFEGAHGSTSVSVATGFVCISANGPVLVTNWHNVAGIDPITGKHLSKMLVEPNVVVISHNSPMLGHFIRRQERLRAEVDGVPLWFEHPRWGREADMVALKLRSLDGVQLRPYDTQRDQDLLVTVSEVVSVVGFPFGLRSGGTAIWATGTVASEPEIDFDKRPIFLIDCRARTGQSGSAVIAHRTGIVPRADGNSYFGGEATRLMGIYSGRVNAESDLGRVWKTSAITELLAAVPP